MNFEELRTNCIQEIESGKYTSLNNIKVTDFRILAWSRIKDERPWYVDNALCWAKAETDGGKKWIIVHMVKNPMKSEPLKEQRWHSYFVDDAANTWFLYFDDPPQNVDIYDKLRSFKFTISDDWELYDYANLYENWKYATGSILPSVAFHSKADSNADSNANSAYDEDSFSVDIDPQSYIDRLTEKIRENPDDWETYLKRAQERYRMKQYEESIEDLKKVIAYRPDNAEAYQSWGGICLAMRKIDKAIKYLDKSISLINSDPLTFVLRGQAREITGSLDGALKDFTRALELNKTYVFAYKLRADLRLRLKDINGSIQDFADSIFSKKTTIQFFLGEQAELYDFRIKKNPLKSDGYYLRGQFLREKKELKRAIKDFEKAIELDPNIRVYYQFLEETQLISGDLDGAKETILKAIEQFKNDKIWWYHRMGIIENYRTDYSSAIFYLNKAKAIKNEYLRPSVYYHLGIAYENIGKNTLAKKDFKKTLELGWSDK